MDMAFSVLALGFLLGIEHATDADHIAAVATIVSRSRRLGASFKAGIFWGIGHTLTLLLVGLALLIFKLSIPIKLALALEMLVGFMLVFLGLWVLRESAFLPLLHRHPHQHEDKLHDHLHLHREEAHHHSHGMRSLAIGMVHGLAGSAALMLLVLATINSLYLGLSYILIFGVGSILGMMFFSGLIGLPFVLSSRWGRLNQVTRILAGIVSLGLGTAIIIEIGWVQGLLKF